MAELRRACLDGNLERVQELHGQGVSLTAANDHGKSDRTDHDDDGNETARNVTFIVGGLGRCLLAA